MIKACIFDLDGVIVDTARYHFLAWKRLAQELGVNLTEQMNEPLKGVSRMQSLDIVLKYARKSATPHEKEGMAARKNGWFVEYVESMSPGEIFPGVKELLQKLRSKGLKIALASSSKNAATVIRLLHLEHEFDAVVDGTMITHSKPDPEIFLLAARKLNVVPGDCVVFEDAEAGVEAAHVAGMKCVGIGSAPQLGKADIVLGRTGDFTMAALQELEAIKRNA